MIHPRPPNLFLDLECVSRSGVIKNVPVSQRITKRKESLMGVPDEPRM
jgi:hypothetical protein